jgi:hypothetical protein
LADLKTTAPYEGGEYHANRQGGVTFKNKPHNASKTKSEPSSKQNDIANNMLKNEEI